MTTVKERRLEEEAERVQEKQKKKPEEFTRKEWDEMIESTAEEGLKNVQEDRARMMKKGIIDEKGKLVEKTASKVNTKEEDWW